MSEQLSGSSGENEHKKLGSFRKLGGFVAAMTVAVNGVYAADLIYTLGTADDRPSSMQWVSETDCKEAKFVVPTLSSTGKDIAGWQAEVNKDAIERAGGVALVTKYSTHGDVEEFRDKLDEALAGCSTNERPVVPVVFNGVSLGGKYAQMVTELGLEHGEVVAIVMESSPTDIHSIKNKNARLLMEYSVNSGTVIMITKGMIFVNALSTEINRWGVGIVTNQQAWHNVVDSTRQTDALVTTWQVGKNAEPFTASRPIPIHYVYSAGDSVVDPEVVLNDLRRQSIAPVTAYQLPREESWPSAPSHGDNWRGDATNAADYRRVYEEIMGGIGDSLPA